MRPVVIGGRVTMEITDYYVSNMVPGLEPITTSNVTIGLEGIHKPCFLCLPFPFFLHISSCLCHLHLHSRVTHQQGTRITSLFPPLFGPSPPFTMQPPGIYNVSSLAASTFQIKVQLLCILFHTHTFRSIIVSLLPRLLPQIIQSCLGHHQRVSTSS